MGAIRLCESIMRVSDAFQALRLLERDVFISFVGSAVAMLGDSVVDAGFECSFVVAALVSIDGE